MKNLLAILLLFFSLCGIAQDSISFQDDFIDNRNNWSISENEGQLTKISDGKYIFENKKSPGAKWAYKQIFIDPTKDFSIESTMTQLDGKDNTGYGLVWGLNHGDDYYVFNIASTFYYTVYEYRNKVYTEIQPWTKFSGINSLNSPNKLMVRKSGNKMLFYINDEKVFQTDYTKLVGTYTGFFINDQKTIAIDNLIIKQDIPTKINLIKNLKTGLKKENLGTNVNSEYDDKLPVISPDGKTLFTDRKGDPENVGESKSDDIWYAEQLNDSTWGQAKNIGFPLNNSGANYVISITPDNNLLLLGNTYKADGSSNTSGFSMSYKTETGWSIPKDVKMKNYYNKHAHASSFLVNNRKVLLLSAQRDDTYGGSDLYVSFLESNGEWSEPKNLGAAVNTFGEEFTPFLSADEITLYYSSNGRRGYGSNDIFVTKRLDSTWTNWSEPENLGPEINTDAWDAYYTVPASGKYAYVASTKNSIGKLDIFKIKLPEAFKPNPVVLIYGKVLNSKTQEPIGADIAYYDLETNKEVGIASSNPKNGSYKIIRHSLFF